MAAIQHKQDYGPFVSGLNTRFQLPSLQDTECSVLQNAQVNNSGCTEKYPGYTVDGTPFSGASFIRTLFEFKRGTTIDYLLIAAADSGNTNSTYKVDVKLTNGDGTYAYIGFTIGTAAFTASNTSVTGTSTSWTKELKAGDKIKSTADADSAYTEIATVNSDTSLTLVGGGYLGSTHVAGAYKARKIWNNNNVIRFCVFNNVAIIVDGDGIPQQYNGTDVIELINSYSGTTLTQQANAAPILQGVVSHKSRVFGWKNSTLYWSHVNDQTFWDPVSLAPIFPQDGGDIIAVVSFADSLVCLKNNGRVYRVFGNFDDSAVGTPAYINKVDYPDAVGIIADRSCIVHNNYLYFIAETGVYSVDAHSYMKRVSYAIEPTTRTFNFSVGGSAQKSFNFTSKTQWDSGTHSGTHTIDAGTTYSFFDDYRQTDAHLGYNQCAIAIGTDNVIHLGYVTNANTGKINYVKYATDGTVTKEDIGVSEASEISSVSIAVSSVDQTVGIVYTTRNGIGKTYYVTRTPGSLGSWQIKEDIGSLLTADGVCMAQLLYSGGGVPYVAWTGFNSPNDYVGFSAKSVGWVSTQISSGSGSGITELRCSMAVDNSSNIYVAYTYDSGSRIDAYKSTNGGTSWSNVEQFSLPSSITIRSALNSFLDHNNSFYTAYTDTAGHIIKRNHTAGTTATFDATANSTLVGFLSIIDYTNLAEKFYCLNNVGPVGSQAEKYFFETSSTLTNPTTQVISKATGARPGNSCLVNNGQTIASVAFGTNANELVIRRICFFGSWTGPENHDTTLTAWGTYQVDGSMPNGNTLTYKIAIASSSPASSFSDITPGSIISSSTSLIYNIPKVTFSLIAWAGVSVTGIILNYTGAGIDARQAYGVSFYNEAYFAVSTTGQTTNNEVLVYDYQGVPLLVTYAVNCMERFKTNLYAGSAVDGKLLVLKQGMAFNTSAYTMDVQTKEDFLKLIEYKKDFNKFYVLYNVQSSGSFVFSYRTDSFATPGGSTWTDITIDQTASGPGISPVLSGYPGIAQVLIGKAARSIQFRIKNANAGETVQILGVTLYYGILNRE